MARNKILSDLAIRIHTQSAELKKGLDANKKQIRGFQKQINNVGGAIVGAFAIQQITNFGKEIFKLDIVLCLSSSYFLVVDKTHILPVLSWIVRHLILQHYQRCHKSLYILPCFLVY